MPEYVIDHFPGSCSGVALNAPAEIGRPYEDQGVAPMLGEHCQPPPLSINFRSKVPTLLEDGRRITELPAMIDRRAKVFPAAGCCR
jgi:glutathione S-transferase